MRAPTTVADIMTTTVVSVRSDAPVTAIAAMMVEHHLTGLPVIDDGKLVGMVTDKDLVVQKSALHIPNYIDILGTYVQLSPAKRAEHEIHKVLGTTAAEVMTENVTTVTPDTSVQALATLMRERGVNPVPVVTARGDVVGIVSRVDLIRLLQLPEA